MVKRHFIKEKMGETDVLEYRPIHEIHAIVFLGLFIVQVGVLCLIKVVLKCGAD